MTVVVREAGPEDERYIATTWRRSERRWGSSDGRAATAGLVRLLMSRSRLLVAAPEGDAVTILAWVALDRDRDGVVHYAYTRASMRRLGFARSMCASRGVDLAQCTMTCERPPGAGWPGVYEPGLAPVLALAVAGLEES